VLAGGIYERLPGAAGQPLGRGYQRREPERTVLHELVSRHVVSFHLVFQSQFRPHPPAINSGSSFFRFAVANS